MHAKKGLTILAFLALAGCGGSSSSPTTADVQGQWQGTYTLDAASGGPTAVTGAIESDGFGFFYDTNGFIYVLPVLKGDTRLTGILTAYSPNGVPFPDFHTIDNFVITGTASDTNIDATFIGNNETGSLDLSKFTPLSGAASLPSGSLLGYYLNETGVALNLTVAGDGTFSGTDVFGCNLSGAITQLGSQNLFTVTVTSTASSGRSSGCAGTSTGLAFESDTDLGHVFGNASGTYFNMCFTNTVAASVVEIKLL